MIEVETPRFGRITCKQEDVFEFPGGLVGLPGLKRFVFREHPSGGPLQWLQSLDVPRMAFVVTNPLYFFPEYRIEMEPAQLEDLGITDPSEGVVLVVLVVPPDPREITANLKAPLIIHPQRRIGRQVIINDPAYPVRRPIFEELSQPAGRAVEPQVD